eukprot:gnl/MRDRNA2_/MRDRNA2_48716_c0_seq1.p1 gnl/MRDRNA2_/MRDRNA2_48716_c0~~gnl/MRDRNA2_/MRDRNA2_48716_c0_seq1.p1  ORF type:complete len:213 (-),score=67.47 gnl/MRDRNA2_/MRDRNA2_48716_c0_seq1:271-909(-)
MGRAVFIILVTFAFTAHSHAKEHKEKKRDREAEALDEEKPKKKKKKEEKEKKKIEEEDGPDELELQLIETRAACKQELMDDLQRFELSKDEGPKEQEAACLKLVENAETLAAAAQASARAANVLKDETIQAAEAAKKLLSSMRRRKAKHLATTSQEELLNEQNADLGNSANVVSKCSMMLICLMMGGGVTFAVLRSGPQAFLADNEPLLKGQ